MLYCNWAPYKQVKTLTFLVFANIFTKKGVRVVVDYVFRHTNDYADMNGRFWRPLTDFKGTYPLAMLFEIWGGGGVT